MSDYQKPFNGLDKYIPTQLRNVMNVSLMRNLFDRMITHEESTKFYGIVGDKTTPNSENKPFLNEDDVDRYFNSLVPAIYYKNGTEENLFTFKDLMNKSAAMGIDTADFANWGKVDQYNWVPPIDLDKFINFKRYYWIQNCLPDQNYNWNPEGIPEYYVIARPKINAEKKYPVDLSTGDNIALNGTLIPNEKWIMTFSNHSNFTIVGEDSGTSFSGIISGQSLNFVNEYLSFTIHKRDIPFVNGDTFTLQVFPLTNKTCIWNFSGIGNGYISNLRSTLEYGSIDGIQLIEGMRILVKEQDDINENGIYLVTAENWERTFDDGLHIEVYIKQGPYKGTVYRMQNGLYTQISNWPNVSIWTEANYWIHEDDLHLYNVSLSDPNIAQALRPILEYDITLEISQDIDLYNKIKINQAPLFNLYDFDGTPILVDGKQLCSALFYYKEDNSAEIDSELRRRVVKQNFNFIFEQGVYFDNRSVFYKLNGELSNIWKKGNIPHVPQYVYKNSQNMPEPFPVDPHLDLLGEGDWLSPFQMEYNTEFEDRLNISYADLHNHFNSIIAAQSGLIGSPFGKNNFRLLDYDLGLGGNIHIIDNQFNLFLGLLNQFNLTPITLIDFAQKQYDISLNSISEFIKLNIGTILLGDFDTLIPDTYKFYKEYYSTKLELQGVYDNNMGPIPNWPLTLPLMNIIDGVEPKIIYNKELNSFNILHHDGHQSPIYQRDITLEQELTGLKFTRYDEALTPGSYGANPPLSPYMGELWFDSVNQILNMFNVDYEGSTTPVSPLEGQYWYDRISLQLKQYVSGSWIISSDNRWQQLDIAELINNVTLLAETELFNYWALNYGGMSKVWDLSNPIYQQESLLKPELSKFAIENNYDPFGSNYVASDAYTWNYSQCSILLTTYGLTSGLARWHKIYEEYLGTSRPDLEPWKIIGLNDKEEIPGGFTQYIWTDDNSRLYKPELWDYILSERPGVKLCVDITNDSIIPPYVNSSLSYSQYALITNISDIVNPSASYVFGDEGPVELVWRNTLEFNYALLRASIKKDPINCLTSIWGFQTFKINNVKYDRISKKILEHRNFSLHNEIRQIPQGNFEFTVSSIASLMPYEFDLTVSYIGEDGIILSNYDHDMRILIGQTGNIVVLGPNGTSLDFIVKFEEKGYPLILGDRIRIKSDGIGLYFYFVGTNNYVYNGLNQIYVNLNKYNGTNILNTKNNFALRKWESKLIYRFDALIDTDSLNIISEYSLKNITSYRPLLKVNEFSKSSWIHALRIQLVQIGTYDLLAPGIYKPKTDGSDWVFRIENYFPRYNKLKKYVTDNNGSYITFNALSNKHTDLEWKLPVDIINIEEISFPINITGIQNVINFIYEYEMYVENDGWGIGQGDIQEVDIPTGRAITWQLEIEKFVDSLYKGVEPGTGLVINPFLKNLWFNTATGLVSPFSHEKFDDISIGQLAYDLVGDVINPSALMVIREDEQTFISSEVPLFGVHVNINEYEHVIIFDDYNNMSTRTGLLYDGFLGMKVSKLLMSGKRQSNKKKRPSYGGFYLNGNTTSKNVSSAIDDLAKYYDADYVFENKTTSKHALALLGYTQKDYFKNIKTLDKTSFDFWRGMINAKGSNGCVDAFLNSIKYETAKLDEFWAYKVAEYGDARLRDYPELKIETNDTILKHTRLYFAGAEDDSSVNAMTRISNTDESRWFSISDLHKDVYFNAKELEPFYVHITEPNTFITLPFVADEILIYDTINDALIDYNIERIKNLDILGRDEEIIPLIEQISELAGEDLDTKFIIVNNQFIKFLIPGRYTIVGYAPMEPKFSPIKLFNYADNQFVEDISVWHPADNIHTYEAMEIINLIGNEDQAKYNYSILKDDNINYNPTKCWGEKEIGRIWWDTTNLDYMPYFDRRIYPSFEERLARWGMMSEYSKINVYEWVKSDVPPNEYDAKVIEEQGNSEVDNHVKKTGTPARKEVYRRDRTWQSRPIAWSYIANPSPDHYIEMLSYATDKLYLTNIEVGSTTVVLETGTFEQYKLTSGMHIGGWIVNKPYGELVLNSTRGYLLGSYTNFGDSDAINFAGGPEIFSMFKAKLNPITAAKPISVGAISISVVKSALDNKWYLQALNQISNISQKLLILDVFEEGQEVIYNFSDLGFTITGMVENVPTPGLTESEQDLIRYSIGEEIAQSVLLQIRQYNNADIIIPFNADILDNNLPVESPIVYSDTLHLQGIINIDSIDFTLKSSAIIGNYSLKSDFRNNQYYLKLIKDETLELEEVEINSVNDPINFNLFDIVITLNNNTSIANLLEELEILTSLIIVGYNNNQVSFIEENLDVIITDYNWRAWSIPTQSDLDNDRALPYSSWSPIYGDWVDMKADKTLIEAIEKYNKAKLTLRAGTIVEKYNSKWSNWIILNDEIQHTISSGELISFTFDKPIESKYFSLYINGINQLTSSYELNDKVPNLVVLKNLVKLGDKVSAYLRHYEPTSDELAFNPEVLDDVSLMQQFKNDYQYVIQPVRDETGVITKNNYYFWVKNRSITNPGKTLSCQQSALLLEKGPSLYVTFQDMRAITDDGYESFRFYDLTRYEVDSLTKLNMKYKAITIANLNTFISKDNTYKLRFTRDFTLRNDPNELDLKNVHKEWELIRPNAKQKIPEKLWNKVVDSACGQDIIGNPLPSKVRIDYDKRHGTYTRYGFESDQIFVEKELIINSLYQAILNPKTTIWVNGNYVPDFINNLDYTQSGQWFETPTSTRQLLNYIWNYASAAQINGIFFEILEDALANNYEFSDLFKTSRLSIHSITTIQEKI